MPQFPFDAEAPADTTPPLSGEEAPFIGNRALDRATRRNSRLGWYVGVPLAVILAGGAAVATIELTGHNEPLTTDTPAQTAAAAPAPASAAPSPAPAAALAAEATPSPAAPAVEPQMASVQPERQPVRHHSRPAPAAAADENAVDTSATAPVTPQGAEPPAPSAVPPQTIDSPPPANPPSANPPSANPPSANPSASDQPTPQPNGP